MIVQDQRSSSLALMGTMQVLPIMAVVELLVMVLEIRRTS